MMHLSYVALSDDDLVETAQYLPASQIKRKHIQKQVLKALQVMERHEKAELVVLHRPDAKSILKNSFEGQGWRR